MKRQHMGTPQRPAGGVGPNGARLLAPGEMQVCCHASCSKPHHYTIRRTIHRAVHYPPHDPPHHLQPPTTHHLPNHRLHILPRHRPPTHRSAAACASALPISLRRHRSRRVTRLYYRCLRSLRPGERASMRQHTSPPPRLASPAECAQCIFLFSARWHCACTADNRSPDINAITHRLHPPLTPYHLRPTTCDPRPTTHHLPSTTTQRRDGIQREYSVPPPEAIRYWARRGAWWVREADVRDRRATVPLPSAYRISRHVGHVPSPGMPTPCMHHACTMHAPCTCSHAASITHAKSHMSRAPDPMPHAPSY